MQIEIPMSNGGSNLVGAYEVSTVDGTLGIVDFVASDWALIKGTPEDENRRGRYSATTVASGLCVRRFYTQARAIKFSKAFYRSLNVSQRKALKTVKSMKRLEAALGTSVKTWIKEYNPDA